MFIRRKNTQEELDADFLKAVKKLRFSKAYKLMNKGASFAAKDDEGNTAFHYLAAGKCIKYYDRTYLDNKDGIKEFICFLLNSGLDIYALNKKGQTCLHSMFLNKAVFENYKRDYVGEFRSLFLDHIDLSKMLDVTDIEGRTLVHELIEHSDCTVSEMGEFISSEASLNKADAAGITPIHIILEKDDGYFIEEMLSTYPSFIAAQDKEGKYLHEIYSKKGKHIFAKELREDLENYQKIEEGKIQKQESGKKEEDIEEKKLEEKKSEEKTLEEKKSEEKKLEEKKLEEKRLEEKASLGIWHLLSPKKVSLVEVDRKIGYKITRIFNFHAQEYTKLAQNLNTEVEAMVEKEFEAFANKTLLHEAFDELKRLGGDIEDSFFCDLSVKKRLSKSSKLVNKTQ